MNAASSSRRFATIPWLLSTAALALACGAARGDEKPARPQPPGPHVKVLSAADLAPTAFGKDQPIVGTYYFYWYDVDTKEHFVESDGADALTHHPDVSEGYSYRSAAWHRRELLNMIEAGLDFFMPVYWGYPGHYDEWSFVGLPPLVEAWQTLQREGKRPPRIGLFYDTSTLRFNRPGFHADLATAEGKEWLYVSARDFYALIPPECRATIAGRPLVWLYSAAFAKQQDPTALDYLRKEFERDFGVAPFVVKEVSWQGRAEATYAWGAALKPNLFSVAAVGPGYDHSAVRGRPPLVREREGGAFYSRSWEWLLSRPVAVRPKLAVVETWNELHEGTEIAPTREDGRKYLALTRKYADLWRANHYIRSETGYGDAAQVSVELAARNKEQGIKQEDREDGRTEALAVAGRDARRTVATKLPGRYIYFDVDESFYCQHGKPVEVSFDYHDGRQGTLVMEYDSTDENAPHVGAFKSAAPIRLEGSDAWRTVVVRLDDAGFTGRANGNDFRFSVPGGDIAISRVTVRKLEK